MTNEEALKILKYRSGWNLSIRDVNALDMAIKALERESQTFEWCHDCSEYDQDKHCCPRFNRVIRNAVEEMKQPKIKTGHWIPVSERLPKTADIYRVTRYYPNNVMDPQYIVDACAFDGFNTWYNDNRINHDRAYADNVIAWQENPEPYKPQESEE